MFSVLLACFGVIIVAYGGADHRKVPSPSTQCTANHRQKRTPQSKWSDAQYSQSPLVCSSSDEKILRCHLSNHRQQAHNPVLGDSCSSEQ